MSGFRMDDDWLVYCQSPSRPWFQVPAGAVDAHCHVFGPGDQFPYAPERKYTPCDAPRAALWHLRDHLGFSRNVIVQATCHGADNRALVDALTHSDGRARGVATVRADVGDEELDALQAAGVRGARFNFVRRLVEVPRFNELEAIAERLGARGWHLVLYFEAQDLPEYFRFFSDLPATVVIDHMGRPDVSQPLDGAGFELFLRLLEENDN
ncbi:MAG: amidohydrolase family protein, partial [Gammaproteobacteria bacterium]|nr:amidohydrolase family protein [Gammaproteobacteria bacterium]